MRRRDFIALFGGGVVAWPLVARAQSGRIWRIGFMAHRYEKFYDPLFQGLRELGYVEGQNLVVERRYADGHIERFAGFAEEMVRLKVDVIIVVTTPAAFAARNVTTTIPIVHPAAIDPVGTGLIASLAHPGGNITGLAFSMPKPAQNVCSYCRKWCPDCRKVQCSGMQPTPPTGSPGTRRKVRPVRWE
jgi:putative tryptophan/tyrosine transport system substrate-binding protein